MSRGGRLRVVLAANLALVGALVWVGSGTGSLGVYAEAVDYLADAAAVGVSLLALRLAARPPTVRHPGGFPRATRYAALVNAGWLLGLSLLVAGGAADRLVTGVRQVHGLPVLVVSGVAAVVMLGGALLLRADIDRDGDDGEDLSVRAVLLDTAADSAAAAGVAGAGAVMYAVHGLYWLDPSVALVITVVVGYHAVRLLARIRASLRA